MVSKLKLRLENWEVESTIIGDVLVEMVSQGLYPLNFIYISGAGTRDKKAKRVSCQPRREKQ